MRKCQARQQKLFKCLSCGIVGRRKTAITGDHPLERTDWKFHRQLSLKNSRCHFSAHERISTSANFSGGIDLEFRDGVRRDNVCGQAVSNRFYWFQKGSTSFKMVPAVSKRFHGFQIGSSEFKKVPRASKRFQRFQKITRVSKRFHWFQNGSSAFKRVSNRFNWSGKAVLTPSTR